MGRKRDVIGGPRNTVRTVRTFECRFAVLCTPIDRPRRDRHIRPRRVANTAQPTGDAIEQLVIWGTYRFAGVWRNVHEMRSVGRRFDGVGGSSLTVRICERTPAVLCTPIERSPGEGRIRTRRAASTAHPTGFTVRQLGLWGLK